MKLFYIPFSPVSSQVRLVAAEAGKELELQALNPFAGENRTPEYLALNPNGRIPTLTDGEFVLWESLAIVNYLASGTPLLPSAPKARAQVDQWMFWKANHLSPAVSKVIFERLMKPKYMKQPTDEAAVKSGLEEWKEFGTTLDRHLAKHPFLANDSLSVADLCVASTFRYRAEGELPMGEYPHIQA